MGESGSLSPNCKTRGLIFAKTLVVLLTGIVLCHIPAMFTHTFIEGSLGVTNIPGNSPNNIIVV